MVTLIDVKINDGTIRTARSDPRPATSAPGARSAAARPAPARYPGIRAGASAPGSPPAAVRGSVRRAWPSPPVPDPTGAHHAAGGGGAFGGRGGRRGRGGRVGGGGAPP